MRTLESANRDHNICCILVDRMSLEEAISYCKRLYSTTHHKAWLDRADRLEGWDDKLPY